MFKNAEKIKTIGAGVRRIYFFAVLALQIIAYPIVIFGIGEFHNSIYYALVISCFLTSLVFLRKDAHALLQCGALLFTCLADNCLILGNGTRLAGMWFFLTVQLFYAARTLLLATSKTERIINASIRVCLSTFMPLIAYMVLGDGAELLFIISLIYYVNLLVSIVFSFLHFRGNELLAIGLTLFACCDLFIGLNEVIKIFSIPKDSLFYQFVHPPFAIEASFYCPSQVLLSLSTQKNSIFVKNSQS